MKLKDDVTSKDVVRGLILVSALIVAMGAPIWFVAPYILASAWAFLSLGDDE
jgi:hypothetical protein